MAISSVIPISFRVADGENGLKKLTMDANELRKVMQATVGVSTDLQKNLLVSGKNIGCQRVVQFYNVLPVFF